MNRRENLVLLWVGIASLACAGAAEPTRENLDFFENRIRPVLIERCYECHSAEAKSLKAALRLDSRDGWMKGGDSGTALVPGSPEQSLLIKAIRYTDEDLRMPPRKNGGKLTEQQIADFEAWVKMGAPDPRRGDAAVLTSSPITEEAKRFWSLVPPRRPAVPAVKASKWVTTPIDAFVLAKLEEKGLSHAPRADRRTLVRRAYFDLLGLPPTPEQVEAFVNDASPEAWPKLIDSLLASKHYGERWGRHWLDVARYADSGGYETDIYYRNAWRYRDYVVNSFNDDKPYDRFVQEQIAGDELWPDNLDLDGSYQLPEAKKRHFEARVATGFYTLGPQVHESNMDAPKLAYERLTDWVDTTASAFMGLTFGCARCHDHKFDPFTQRDYFALQAVFAGSREVEAPIIPAMGIADFKQHYPRVIAASEARKAYRLFEAHTRDRELTPEEKQKKQRLLEGIANAVLSMPESTAHDGPFDGLMEIPTVSVLGHERPELVPVIHILNRGEIKRARDPVGADLPAVLKENSRWEGALPGPFGSRKQLALWLTKTNHPLTARVMVNRVWHWHFERGIVATLNDFGKMGELPSHPELLDWLAVEFMTQGWSLKTLHRLILRSSAYQMDSRFAHEANLRADPENRLLWRANRRRLEAETIWDNLHAVAGTLNLALGGRPVAPPLTGDEMPSGNWIVSADPKDHTRRGLYILTRRNFRFPLFDVFDLPVNSVSAAARDVTTVAPQALWFMNNKVAGQQAREFAARLVGKPGQGWNEPDFGPGQTGWEGKASGVHAGWAKRVDNGHSTPSFDDPIGTVITHGMSSVLWKAPPDYSGGPVKITGGVWNIRQLGRGGSWKLWKNDRDLLTEAGIDDASGTSSRPFGFARGRAGAEALEAIPCAPGDSFRLEILQGDFVGVNFTITSATQTNDLAAAFSLAANPTPAGWQYCESLAHGGGVIGKALRVERTIALDPVAWIDRAWRWALGRAPTPTEKSESLEMIDAFTKTADVTKETGSMPDALKRLPKEQAAALTKFCLSLLNLNEFSYID
ncbi:MAG: DUF1549 domain-containing protein [Verrucomicrobia bacterium]|nr:DUF1549 domain-containing protein [Verrucomicrobiota bacterium]